MPFLDTYQLRSFISKEKRLRFFFTIRFTFHYACYAQIVRKQKSAPQGTLVNN